MYEESATSDWFSEESAFFSEEALADALQNFDTPFSEDNKSSFQSSPPLSVSVSPSSKKKVLLIIGQKKADMEGMKIQGEYAFWRLKSHLSEEIFLNAQKFSILQNNFLQKNTKSGNVLKKFSINKRSK